ncbi:Uncharacterised protein [Escherichia coli]|uniref:hypothetical protein n=1 Tax=Escherichia coli TaxID=562 RepID=UPI001A5C4C09|nr:hypothetical protein [Escherichia coli]VVZ32244.1 Uncharacterised protein [Escherichia coli]VVZ33194.1 Uncharacterised protein [Escherichia coli]VWN20624.1 Uncharacterised protein [Escherichia coli]
MRILTQAEHHERLINNMAYILHMSHIRGIAYKRELVMALFIGTNFQERYVKDWISYLIEDITGKL